MANKKVEITLNILRETEKAILVTDCKDINEEKNEQWIPKSQIDVPPFFEIGDTMGIVMPEWLAKTKDFI